MVSAVIPMGNRDKVYSGGQQKAQKNIIKIEGDSRVDDLMIEFINFPKRTIYWEYRDKAIKLAQELFSSRSNWFIAKESDGRVSDIKLMFIVDTLRYVFTGRRRFAITAWGDLLGADNGEIKNLVKRTDVTDYLRSIEVLCDAELELNNIIQKWMTQPQGFDDMVFTLYYIFGSKNRKV